MKKILILLSFVLVSCSFSFRADANDYNTATGAHIITETLKGTDMDYSEILNSETQRLIHGMSLDIIDIIFETMPSILDSISAELRLQADKDYKCALQSNDYKNKDCK